VPIRFHLDEHIPAGIAYCRQGASPMGAVLRRLLLLYDLLSPEEMVGRVEFL